VCQSCASATRKQPVSAGDIVSAHPEIYEKEIPRAVESPTTVLAGHEPDEEWLYLEGAGPSRWLRVVVAFDSEDRGRIIISFAHRRKP
jgi:hypothetical protein